MNQHFTLTFIKPKDESRIPYWVATPTGGGFIGIGDTANSAIEDLRQKVKADAETYNREVPFWC